MAEEKHLETHEPSLSHDDMAVLNTLLHNIKGLSPVSTVPELVEIAVDDEAIA